MTVTFVNEGWATVKYFNVATGQFVEDSFETVFLVAPSQAPEASFSHIQR